MAVLSRLFGICCLLSLAQPCAAAADDLNALQQLLQQQQSDKAWQLAQQLQASQEGEPQFDYLFGLAARAAGQFHQAVFALERAVLALPDAPEIRLALAVSYFELGNMTAANTQLTMLAGRALPPEPAQLVQRYLQRIRDLPDPTLGYWQNWLQLGFGLDSNPNSGVDDELVNIPLLGDVRLFRQSVAQQSSFADLQAQLSWIKPLDQQRAYYLAAGLLHSQFQEDTVAERSYLQILAGYQTRLNKVQLTSELFYRPIRLDGDSYLNYQGVRTSVSYPVFAQANLGLDVSYSGQNYQQQDGLDRDQWLTDGWWSWRSLLAEHKLSLRYGQDQMAQRRTDFHARILRGISYRWQLQWHPHWQSTVLLEYLQGDFRQIHPLYGVTRADHMRKAEWELSYQWHRDWRLSASVSHLRNDSNINLYHYRRNRIWSGVRYVF